MLTALLASFGLCIILTKSSLFAPLRALAERRVPKLAPVVTCTMCCGFWCGLALELLGIWPPMVASRWLDALAAGWTSSGVCWALGVVVFRLIPPGA